MAYHFSQLFILIYLTAAFISTAGEPLTTKAKSVVNQSTNAELQLLQGTWEGYSLQKETGDGPIVKGTNTIKVTITDDTLHFHRDSNFWFETAITLQPGSKPKQLHAKITRGSSSTGEVVVVIYKIEDGTLTLATDNGSEDPLKAFDDAPNRYELRKVQQRRKSLTLPSAGRKGPPKIRLGSGERGA